MKRFTLFFILLAEALLAQSREVEKILQKKDVIWAAEIELEYAIEPEFWSTPDSLLLDKCKTVGTHLKQVAQSDTYERSFPHLADYLNQAWPQSKSEPLFDTATNYIQSHPQFLQKTYPAYFLHDLDSIISIDPETFDEVITIQKVDILHRLGEYFKSISIRQIIYYSAKRQEFAVKVLGWAPVFTIPDDGISGQTEQYIESWLAPARVKSNAKNIHSEHVPWAYRVETDIQSAINFDKLKPLKGDFGEVKRDIIQGLRYSRKIKVQDMDARALSMAQRIWLSGVNDTLVDYTSNYLSGQLTIIEHKLNPDKLSNWKFIHDLYWNEKHKLLVIQPKCVAAVLKRSDVNHIPNLESDSRIDHLNFAAFYLPIATK